MLAFPGFGQSPGWEKPLIQGYESQYTVLSIGYPPSPSFPYPKDIAALSPQDLTAMVDELVGQRKWETVQLLGYSIGARLAMTVFEQRSHFVNQLCLLVPDGWYRRPIYHFCTRSSWGRRIFATMAQRPQILQAALQWADRFGFLPSPLVRFVMGFWQKREEREKLVWIWSILRQIEPSLKRMESIQQSQPKPIDLFLGQRDPLISAEKVRRRAQKIPGTRIHVLDRGHFILDETTLPLIQKSLSL